MIAVMIWSQPGVAQGIAGQGIAEQGNAEQGRQIGFTCLGCHGIEGQRNAYPSYRVPRLGGQGSDYLETALQAYREGTRPHPTMQAQAGSLSDADIADIIAWLESGEEAKDSATVAMVGDFDAAAVCVSCHGADGEGVVPQPPTLAGQHADYLQHAMNQYKDGTRSGNVMVAFAASLSDADIEVLARFYASMDGLETLER